MSMCPQPGLLTKGCPAGQGCWRSAASWGVGDASDRMGEVLVEDLDSSAAPDKALLLLFASGPRPLVSGPSLPIPRHLPSAPHGLSLSWDPIPWL